MGRDSIDELVRAAIRLDDGALAQLVDRYHGRVYGLLYRLTRSRETAEDLTQETFLRVVRTIGGYTHDGRFEAWLFRIAANLARDHGRRRTRRGVPVSLDSGGSEGGRLDPPPESQPGPEVRLLEMEWADRVNAKLAELPELDREILLLRHFGELSFKEIAETLRVPLGTALARAHRAIRKLRQALGAPLEPNDEAG